MINEIAKKNQKLVDFVYLCRFLKRVPFADFFNLSVISLVLKVQPNTMVSYQRLKNVYDLARAVERTGLNGAFVECGVWRGGCSAVMAHVAHLAGNGRKVWLFDSFEGLPEPTEIDGEMAREFAQGHTAGRLKSIQQNVGPLEDVKALFNRLHIAPENVVVQKGWFQDTLPVAKNEIGDIAILRLDGDWYESTMCCLDHLYDSVVPGGYVILDDYRFWEGCQIAADEFLRNREINVELQVIDEEGVYFQKPN